MEGTEIIIWAIVAGFAVVSFLLYVAVDELEDVRAQVREIKSDLAWKGTIHQQLLDIEKAIQQSR